MKIKVLVIVLFLFSATAYAQDTLEARIKKLEIKVTELENLIKITPLTKPLTTSYKSSSTTSRLVLSDWSYSFEKERSSGYYVIKYSLTNSYDKTIKLVDASLQFKDLLGERLYGIKIKKDLRISSGKTVKDGGSYRINQFMNEQLRMKNMVKEDVIVTLKVRKIVFTDNTILEMYK